MIPHIRPLGVLALLCASLCVAQSAARAQFSVEQTLQAPYAVSLVAAPSGAQFAWVEVQEGRHTLWVGSPGKTARALTRYTEDDGQELREVVWLPGGAGLAYTRGPETGADGKPANAAHLQPPPVPQVWIVSAGAGNPPVPIGEGHAPLPTPDGKHLLLVRGGQIWIADLPASRSPGAAEGGSTPPNPARQLVFDRGSASQMTLSPDGGTLAFISRRDHSHGFLALFDLQRHLLSFPAASTGNDSAPVFSPDGRELAWVRMPWTDAPEFAANRTSPNPWSLQVLDLATGKVRTAFAPRANQPGSAPPHVSSGEPRIWWAAGHTLLFPSEADGWLHLYTLDPGQPGAEPHLLTPGAFEIEDPALSADGKQLVYAANAVPPGGDPADADRRHLWSVDLASPSAKPLLLTPGVNLQTHPVFAGDGTGLAALEASTHLPSLPVFIPRENSARPEPLQPQPSGTANTLFVTPQPVLFPSADKLFTLHGQLFETAANGSAGRTERPALIFFHGGPRRQMLLGYPAMEYYEHAYALNQYFASRGFVVLSVNYRRGIGYGLDFREAANTGADGASEYNDVLGAVAYLRSRPDVDPKRIGLWGGSYGGYLTALGLARNSDLFAAGVDFHGVHEWILEDNRADWLRGTAAEQAAITERAHKSSPLADVDHWKSPVLLIHGDNDANVAYAQTPLLADALRGRSVPVEELIFPDEIHEFLLYRDWIAAYKATAAFLEERLHPGH